MPTLAELVTKFSHAHGASGFEDNVRALVVREMKKYADDVQITPLGSVIGIQRARSKRGTENPRLLVEAHMDEIGLLVTGIEEGFIRFNEIGHFDPRVLPSQNVLVHGRKTLAGVIGARPPHVLTAAERQKSIPMRDLFIDVGMDDARVRELVSVGDFITLDRNVVSLQNNFVAGKAMDDRSSLVAVLEFLRQLQNAKHAWDVYAVANVNEEDSSVYVGALTSTFAIRPHLALCLDVTHAQQPGLHEEYAPKTGQGPCIARGANVHPFVFEKLRAAATQAKLAHQITVYGDNTETNAWLMQLVGEGVPTGLVEIPLRYMHTSVETIHLDDVANAAELLRAFATSLTLEDADALQGEKFVRAAHSSKPRIGKKRAPSKSKPRATNHRRKPRSRRR